MLIPRWPFNIEHYVKSAAVVYGSSIKRELAIIEKKKKHNDSAAAEMKGLLPLCTAAASISLSLFFFRSTVHIWSVLNFEPPLPAPASFQRKKKKSFDNDVSCCGEIF